MSSRRQERGSSQRSEEAIGASSGKNELKQVFAKLQHKSVAQKLQHHLDKEEREGAKPAKENREEDRSEEGSMANVKSE